MILEHALLSIKPGKSKAFEAALSEAIPLIAASPGFRGIEVLPAERSDRYLLIVRWSDIAAHRDGFRNSARYRRWQTLLHQFYDPMPTVTYFGPDLLDQAMIAEKNT